VPLGRPSLSPFVGEHPGQPRLGDLRHIRALRLGPAGRERRGGLTGTLLTRGGSQRRDRQRTVAPDTSR
jgi:hypothetical protein